MRQLKRIVLRGIDCEDLGFEIVYVNHESEFDQAEKNAKLINAADDMLHANQCFIDAMNKTWFIEPYWNDDRIYDELPSIELANAYFAARDAIKKALGE